jgi:folate-binding protein YgfZ
VQADFYAIEHLGGVVLAIAGGVAETVLTTLDAYLVMEDAEISLADISFSWAWGTDVMAATARLGVDAFGAEAFVLPTRLCVMGPGAHDKVTADPGSVWVDPLEFEMLRVQSRVAKYGVDFDEHDNLHAAGLERKVVDWSKGCYLGQEVVCMQEMRGKVRKSLVGVEAVDGAVLTPGELFNEASELVGKCTSSAGKFGMAQVRAPENAAGTRLHLRGRDGSAQGAPVLVTGE